MMSLNRWGSLIRGRLAIQAALAILVLALVGCSDGVTPDPDPDPDPEPDPDEFVASLSADNVVGGNVVSDGTGSAEFVWDSVTLDYGIEVFDMEGVTAAHIHGPGEVDENANIILTLFAPSAATGAVNGELVTGSVGEGSGQLTSGITLDSVLTLMYSQNAYVLVHTSEYPGGEIRGQISQDPLAAHR